MQRLVHAQEGVLAQLARVLGVAHHARERALPVGQDGVDQVAVALARVIHGGTDTRTVSTVASAALQPPRRSLYLLVRPAHLCGHLPWSILWTSPFSFRSCCSSALPTPSRSWSMPACAVGWWVPAARRSWSNRSCSTRNSGAGIHRCAGVSCWFSSAWVSR